MAISTPYHRMWRPLKGYDPLSGAWYDNTPTPTLDYLADNSFATQLEMQSLLTTAHLIGVKLKQMSVASLFAEAIRRVLEQESISDLYLF